VVPGSLSSDAIVVVKQVNVPTTPQCPTPLSYYVPNGQQKASNNYILSTKPSKLALQRYVPNPRVKY
jgi:hypothetical protein